MRRLLFALMVLVSSSISSFAYQYGAVTVTGSATLILSANRGRTGVLICNSDNSSVFYIGLDSSVTTSNGIEIQANSCYAASAPQETWKGAFYGVSGGSIDVRYQEYGLGDIQ